MYVETSAAKDATAVTPSDSTVVRFEALYVGTGGDVSVVTDRGTTTVFANVPAGAILPIAVTRVRSTDTTASDIVGLVY